MMGCNAEVGSRRALSRHMEEHRRERELEALRRSTLTAACAPGSVPPQTPEVERQYFRETKEEIALLPFTFSPISEAPPSSPVLDLPSYLLPYLRFLSGSIGA